MLENNPAMQDHVFQLLISSNITSNISYYSQNTVRLTNDNA